MLKGIRCIVLVVLGFMEITAQELFLTIKVDSTNAGTASPGRGTGYAVLSNDMKSLRYRVTVNKLNGNISAAHFHYKPTNGVVHEVVFTGKTASGTWINIPDSLVDAIFNQNLYLNVHTSSNPGGEIRGELEIRQFGFPIVINGTNAGTASSGTGTAYAYFDNTNQSADITEIRYRATYAGLSGTITASHFHDLPAGSVMHTVQFSDSTTDGTWTGFSDANLLKFFKKQMYLNIHTSSNPGGEVRGDLSVVGELGFTGILDGAQASTASNGKGTVWAVLRQDMSVKYSATFAKMTGNYSASHFHTTTNGGVVKDVPFSGNHAAGDWTGMSDVNIQDLLKGRIYLNIHSSTNAGGEIRANMFHVAGMFGGVLDGAQAVTSSTAKGTVWIDVGDDSAQYHATIAGLNGTFSAAHFHTTNGGGIVNPVIFTDSTTSGYWNMGSKIVELARGKIYLNVHSSTNAGGEIRANMKIGSGTATSVRRVSEQTPSELTLDQNFPNPFNPNTTISFHLPAARHVTVKIFDALGREMATALNEVKLPGSYTVDFNASNLASGIYFYQLRAGNAVQTKKMMLMK